MLLLGCSIAFVACDNDNKQEMKDIRLGADDINEVSLNKLSTRTIILSGGTGKYGRAALMPPSFQAISKSV